MPLVQVMPACAEAFFGGQHLPYGDAVFAEQFVITVYQLRLPYGGIQLPLVYAVQLTRYFYLTPSRGDRSRRDQYHLDSCLVQFCHLVDQCRHAGYVQCPVLPRQHVAPYFYRYPVIWIVHFINVLL